MFQQEIEIILSRQLAEYLTLPIFIVDPNGDLLYYNDPAESILGVHYEETGPMPASKWSTMFEPMDPKGRPLNPESLPLMIALVRKKPAHSIFWIHGLDQTHRKIEVTAFPLNGQTGRFLGAVAIFWESEE